MDLPSEASLRWILKSTAELSALGAEPVRGLILPNNEHFPDAYDGSPRAVTALLQRVLGHAGLKDLDVEIAVVTPEGEVQSSGCSTGACGTSGKIEASLARVSQRSDGGYTVAVGTGEMKHPAVLTVGLVRAVGFMFMSEAGGYDSVRPRDREAITDLAAVMLGFGVIMANGSHIAVKGCGGMKVHSATKMTEPELAIALAVSCKLFSLPERSASRELDPSPRGVFDEAWAWATSNEKVIALVEKRPEALIQGDYKLAPAHGLLSRVFGFGKKRRPLTTDEELDELERALTSGGPGASAVAPKRKKDPAQRDKLDEIRALVDESL